MLNEIRSLLQAADKPAETKAIFFKTGPGHYAEGDQFIGVNVPTLRKIAKQFSTLSLQEIGSLLQSPINEERLLALFILIGQYQKSEGAGKNQIHQFYMDHLRYVNNWNLVDSSAHLLVGAHLSGRNRELLVTLAHCENLWERRIAIVATLHFIRQNDFEWTYKIAKILLKDSHDLIHKAVGWMLREAGERDKSQLIHFLDAHASEMPRTMLRYAIEKFPQTQRQTYLMR